jgi:glyoxylase-like metal-dependent hydrolase (beta-lactamase superfamily II)
MGKGTEEKLGGRSQIVNFMSKLLNLVRGGGILVAQHSSALCCLMPESQRTILQRSTREGHMKPWLISALLTLLCACAFSQTLNVYEIYAIEYARPKVLRAPATRIALNTTSNDSITWSYCVWYLKGENGRKILVDTGFIEDSTRPNRYNMGYYERPDLALKRMNVDPNEITDVIITHPHVDHIGGLDLFGKATVWMQKNDYAYFVGDAWQKDMHRIGFDKQDVLKIVQVNLDGRLQLVNGDSVEIIPGIRVFIGSKHTFECQYLLVNTRAEKVVVASDACWFYYNLDHLASVPLTLDANAYISQLRRMKTLVSDPQSIIPGHDGLVMTRFKQVAEGIVRIR